MIAVHVIPARYCDVLHRSALHLGAWVRADKLTVPYKPINPQSASSSLSLPWNPELIYPPGIIVRHCKEQYRSMNICNAAEPNNVMHNRFYVSLLLNI